MTDKQREETIDIIYEMMNTTLGNSETMDTVDEEVQYETIAMFIDKLRVLARSKRCNRAIEIARFIDRDLDKRGIIGLPFLEKSS